MRIVVVDPDQGFAALVADRLTDEGHEVACAENPQQLEALIRARPVEAVLCDLSLRRMNGFELAQQIYEKFGEGVEIILVSPSHTEDEPEVRTLMAAVDARAFYQKPVDLDLLVQDLAQPRTPRGSKAAPSSSTDTPSAALPTLPPPRTAPATPRVRASVCWENARMLVELWAGRSTGRLQITGGKKDCSASIKTGGLSDPNDIASISLALDGGEIEFHEEEVEGVSDWALLGSQVFVRCRSACEDNTVLGYMNAVPRPTDRTIMARALPITGPTRRLLGSLDEDADLTTLLERCQATQSEVSADIEALVRLRILTLHRGATQDSAERQVGIPEMEIGPAESKALRDARSSSDLDGLPAIDRMAVADAHEQESPEQLMARLEREFATIEGASPAVVLGVPADAVTATVDRSAARMRRRYVELSVDDSVDKAVRSIAKKMSRLVDEAHRHFQFSDHVSTGSQDVSERVVDHSDAVDMLLGQGRKFISRGEWAAADAVLTEAHRQQLDHAGVLSNLGWARLHNPGRADQDRTDEARDLLLLAEQFDPGHSEGQYYLAQFLMASGMLEAAVERARRAKEAAPGEPARVALYRKLQIKLAAAAET